MQLIDKSPAALSRFYHFGENPLKISKNLLHKNNLQNSIDIMEIVSKVSRILSATKNRYDENERLSDWLQAVRQQVSSVRYGIVQLVIHDSRVVQIERTEKIRFDQAPRE